MKGLRAASIHDWAVDSISLGTVANTPSVSLQPTCCSQRAAQVVPAQGLTPKTAACLPILLPGCRAP